MPFNPLAEKSLQNLKTAIDQSYRELRPFRRHSYDAMQMYAGRYYGGDTTYANSHRRKQTPLNLLQLTVDIYVQSIAPVIPRFLARSKVAGLKRQSSLLDMALNHVADEINLQKEFQNVVMNAMFSQGIMKVGTAAVDKGTIIDATQPFAVNVSLDDWVVDFSARNYEEARFAGNQYRMSWDIFHESGLYKNTDKVKAYEEYDDDEYALKNLSGYRQYSETYRRSVELIDVWLPEDNLVVTIPAKESPVPLRVVEWEGVEQGPYHLLSFAPLPDNIMPVAPAQSWRDISELANDLMIKVANQSRRQKNVTAYGVGASEDAKRIKNANDGDMIGVTDPSKVAEMRMGGADPATQAALLQLRDWNSYQAGNIDLIGGLAAQSQTLGQDQLLGQSASKRLEIMRQRFWTFAEGVGKAIANELWYDPLIDLPLVKRTKNIGIEIPVRFNEDAKEGDFLDYNIAIDPYSTTHMSPPERMNMLMTMLSQVIFPSLPFLQQQGGQLHMPELLDILSRYSDMPEIEKLVQFQDPEADLQQEPVDPPPTSNTSTREYIRRNVPTGGTQAFRDQQMSQALLGQNTQPKERAAAARFGVA